MTYTNTTQRIAPPTTIWNDMEWFPIGYLSMIAGDPGIGKSYLTHELASRVSRSGQSALLITGEDGIGDTVLPRLTQMNADLDRIACIDDVELRLDRDIEKLESIIEQIDDLMLVVIDPISTFMGAYNSDNGEHVRALLTRLALVANDHQIAIVIVSHLSKSNPWEEQQRVLGSVSFTNCSSVVTIITQDNSTHNNTRRVSMVKNTVSEMMPDRFFTITDQGIRWVLPQPSSRPQPRVRFKQTSVKADRAIAFLQRTLRDGPVPTRQIFELGARRSMSKNTLIRAKEILGVQSIKLGKNWAWHRAR